MFYERFVTLCNSRGVSPSRAAQDAGLSKSIVTTWKNDPDTLPTGNVIDKLSRYFGVSVSELLGDADEPAPRVQENEPAQEPGGQVSFYDRLVYFSRRRGVSPSRAALDAGLSKSIVTKWKNDPSARPTGSVLGKLAAYFGVSVSELLGDADEPAPHRPVSEEDIKFALFGGSEDITAEMYEEVRSFAAFVKEREAAKKR